MITTDDHGQDSQAQSGLDEVNTPQSHAVKDLSFSEVYLYPGVLHVTKTFSKGGI